MNSPFVSAEELCAAVSHLPHITSDIAAIPGELKLTEEDFLVEEIPAYLPGGSGEHLYLWVEKRGVSTPDAARHIAQALGPDVGVVGWAGLKDKQGVTRQWLSFQCPRDISPQALQLENITVLQAGRHSNKLRPGHLRGNHFRIRLANVPAECDERAHGVLSRLAAHGMPNYFGPQRFGRAGRNLSDAWAWVIAGGRAPRKPFLRTLLVSSLQSALFNLWLGARLEQGLLDGAISGDILRKEETGGIFVCEDEAIDSERSRAWEISATGPLFGARMRRASRQAGEIEDQLLARWGLDFGTLERVKKYGEGARRVGRVRPERCSCTRVDGDLMLEFTLPSGSYATVLVSELTKRHGLTLEGA